MEGEEFHVFGILVILIILACTGKMLYTEHVANFGCVSYHCK